MSYKLREEKLFPFLIRYSRFMLLPDAKSIPKKITDKNADGGCWILDIGSNLYNYPVSSIQHPASPHKNLYLFSQKNAP